MNNDRNNQKTSKMKLNLRIYLCLITIVIPFYIVMEISKFSQTSRETVHFQMIHFSIDNTSLKVRESDIEMEMVVDPNDLEYIFDRIKYPQGRQTALLKVEPLMHNPHYCFTSAYHSPYDQEFDDHAGSQKHGSFSPQSGWIPMDDKIVNNATQKIHWVFYVHTSIMNHQKRQVIRKTWGFPRLFKDYNMRILFVVGKSDTESHQQRLEMEYSLYGDILQGDFLDSYKNLTYKGVFTLRWLSTYCSHVPIVMKADDDTFVNIFHFKKYLTSYSDFETTEDSDEDKDSDKERDKGRPKLAKILKNTPKTFGSISKSTRSLICNIYSPNSMPILRDKGKCQKWCVSKMDLPGLKYYPKYCAGLLYVITMPLVKKLYAAVKTTPFLWIDDVYVTGLLPESVKNIKYVNIGIDSTLDVVNALMRYKNLSAPLTHHVIHAGDLERFSMLWNSLLRRLTDAERKELALPPEKLKLQINVL